MQLGLIPGKTVRDKRKRAADHGVEGIEASHGNYPKELGDVAESAGTLLLPEPLNRYEEHLLRRQGGGWRLSSAAGSRLWD